MIFHVSVCVIEILCIRCRTFIGISLSRYTLSKKSQNIQYYDNPITHF